MLSDHLTSFGSLSETQKDRKLPSATDMAQDRSPGCQSSCSPPLGLDSHFRKNTLPQSQTPRLEPNMEPDT